MEEEKYSLLRRQMVETQLVARGIQDPNVLKSMGSVPRHIFVPEELRDFAYQDGPLPIGEKQTISQPFIVALMSQLAACDENSKVLDIGTGSGYAAAVFSRYVNKVYTIERLAALSEKACACFNQLHFSNIHAIVGDGSKGWPEYAPYDAIVVTAGAPVVPQILLDQLALGGKLVIPVGEKEGQRLVVYTKRDDATISKELKDYVRFVPLIGEKGWE